MAMKWKASTMKMTVTPRHLHGIGYSTLCHSIHPGAIGGNMPHSTRANVAKTYEVVGGRMTFVACLATTFHTDLQSHLLCPMGGDGMWSNLGGGEPIVGKAQTGPAMGQRDGLLCLLPSWDQQRHKAIHPAGHTT